MEWDLPGEVVREQEEASGKGEGVEVGWGEHAPEPAPAGVVSVPVVGQGFPIKLVLPAIT